MRYPIQRIAACLLSSIGLVNCLVVGVVSAGDPEKEGVGRERVDCTKLNPVFLRSGSGRKIPEGYSIWGAETPAGPSGHRVVALVCSKDQPRIDGEEMNKLLGVVPKPVKVDPAWYGWLFSPEVEYALTRTADMLNSMNSPAAFSLALAGQNLTLAGFLLPPESGGKVAIECVSAAAGFVITTASMATGPALLLSAALTGRSVQNCLISYHRWHEGPKEMEEAKTSSERLAQSRRAAQEKRTAMQREQKEAVIESSTPSTFDRIINGVQAGLAPPHLPDARSGPFSSGSATGTGGAEPLSFVNLIWMSGK